LIGYVPAVRWLVLAVCLLAGCGDNQHGEGLPLAAAHELLVVAHQDDDLLFMQPDVIDDIHAGLGVTSVYVTAGNGKKGPDAANKRYRGLMVAYAHAAHDDAWECGWISIRGHVAQHCRLDAENVSLVFLGYPDGGIYGELDHSLLKLWQGDIANATTVADRTTRYDRDGLIEVVAAVVHAVDPAVVRTLDLTAGHGRDHSDHMIVGALTALALARDDREREVIAYRGYDMLREPANKTGALYAAMSPYILYYQACASTGCEAPCGEACPSLDGSHAQWLGRRYAIGVRNTARGRLRVAGGCLAGATLGPCTTAPIWTLDHGRLASAAGCLAVASDGGLEVIACSRELAERWLVDDEGHLWSGLPPAPAPDLTYAHLRCVTPHDDGSIDVPTCDNAGGVAPRWQWAPELELTSHAVLAATGRSVRIADVTGDGRGDLCAVTTAGLECAPGAGDGTFGAAVRIDAATAPLAIEPESLTLGDLDGDGLADACGRDRLGILCALSSTGYAAGRFSPVFGDDDAHAGTGSSLRIEDANGEGTPQVCGLANEGVVCSPAGTSFETHARSTWPASTDLLVPADLDGDHRADWCALTADGASCGLSAESAITTDGVPWSFSVNGVVEVPPTAPALSDLADIDGDGDRDLCALSGDGTITCARSSGHGFGPRSVVAVLPDGASATALWLGDLDGDGRADACVDLGDQIACAIL